MIDQIATLFCKLGKADKVTAMNVLAHLLPTSGVNFDVYEEQSLEHTIDMLQRALILHEYTGPSEEQLLKHVALLGITETAIAEEVDEPSYVNPDRDQVPNKVKETAPEPNFEPAE